MPDSTTAGSRPAPGNLRLVQDLLNARASVAGDGERALASAVRGAHGAGQAQATIAASHGISQQLVSAILRGARDGEGASVATPAHLESWLRERRLIDSGADIDPAMHARVLRLREALVGMALENARGAGGGGLSEAAFAEQARGVALEVAARPTGGFELVPGERRAGTFVARVVAAVYDAHLDGTWARLKACPAERCGHVFYDTSRNRTATWCSMAICGNRSKVRSYQVRRRKTAVE